MCPGFQCLAGYGGSQQTCSAVIPCGNTRNALKHWQYKHKEPHTITPSVQNKSQVFCRYIIWRQNAKSFPAYNFFRQKISSLKKIAKWCLIPLFMNGLLIVCVWLGPAAAGLHVHGHQHSAVPPDIRHIRHRPQVGSQSKSRGTID